MIETTALRNIHLRSCSSLPDPSRPSCENSSSSPARFRKVPRSPDEEFCARVTEHGNPLQFPKSVIGLILQKQTRAEVGPSGIAIQYQKTSYRYWSDESQVCHNQRGERVLVTFDPDDMDFIHVLTEDGRYIESVPQKNKISWFDDAAMREEMKKKAHSLNRDLAQFQAIHKDTTEEKIKRVISNSEKMQIVNTLPCPSLPSSSSHPSCEDSPSASFPKADRISRAATTISGQRQSSERLTQRTASRVSRLPEDSIDIWDRAEEMKIEADREYAETAAALDELDQLY